jgi:hypothetical protein
MSKKPTDFELFNDDSLWGNQTAGGLTDKEILDAKWNYITANREKAKDPNWLEAQRKGCQDYLNNPNYVNPRGMLGKTKSEETKLKQSLALKGKPKSKEHNIKLRQRKGIKLTTGIKNKISDSLKGRTSDRCRRVHTPLGEFAKLKLAAAAYNKTPETIKLWMKKNPKEFYFIDSIDILGPKKIHTPEGIFDNIKKASEFYSISIGSIRTRISKKWDNWYYLEEKSEFISPQIKDNK